MAKVVEFGQTLLIMLIVVGTAWWIGMIVQASGEDKLSEACAPVQYATDGLHVLSSRLAGYPPRWTLQTQSYLMSGCYYGFSSLFSHTVTTDPAVDKR